MTQPHPEGWYPDPERSALQRYWDGQQWTDQTRSVKDSESEKSRRRQNRPWVIALGVAVVAFLIFMIVQNTSDDPEPANADSGPSISSLEIKAKVACSMALERSARDPDSVEYRDVSVVVPPAVGDVWIVVGEVNAANGLGGKTGFQDYRCEARYDEATDEMAPTVTSPR